MAMADRADPALLQRALDRVWHADHAVLNGSRALLVDAFAGRWTTGAGFWPRAAAHHAARSCETPLLWIFLYGHVRTFSWTRGGLARLINASVGSRCAFK